MDVSHIIIPNKNNFSYIDCLIFYVQNDREKSNINSISLLYIISIKRNEILKALTSTESA